LVQANKRTVGEVADPPGSELAARLESAFRLLGTRIYLPSLRQLSAHNDGLDRASLPVLSALEEQGELRPSDVAAAVELDLSTVSRQLRQLQDVGLVARRADSVDGRARRVSLTPEGRESLVRVRASRARMLGDLFRDWPKADRELVGLNALPAKPSPARRPQEEDVTDD
jgi:DNA-binding MarR family transcriptional regulator